MTVDEFRQATGEPLENYAFDCHRAALALVQSGVLGECRVARGFCPGVGGQHSWVVLGHDCYAKGAHVIDPTLWSYDPTVTGVWEGRADAAPQHTPHGSGLIWQWGRPDDPHDEPYELRGDFSREALRFLDILGPLDFRGWCQLAHAPVEGWPSGEIIAAMYADPMLKPHIPIDIVGMVTDLNPGGLYLPEKKAA